MNSILKAMSDYVFTSRYARYSKELKRRLTWKEVSKIVRDMHLEKYPQIEEEINWAFDLVDDKVTLGSQRALQFGGIPIKKKEERIYNCSASYCDRPRFFQEAMFLLLCGCGVGFSVQKHHVAKLPKIQKRSNKEKVFIIPDNIEGWSDAIGVLLSSYFIERQEFPEFFNKKVIFDYSQIRPEGSPLSSGVGKAPGPNGLKASLEKIERLLDSLVSDNNVVTLRPINTYDVICHCSDSVLSGGVRRSSCITLFSPDDEEMMNSKTGDWRITNPQRGRSNNSVLLIRDKVDKKYFKDIIEKVKQFGEPGFIFADDTESLVNPCITKDLWINTKEGYKQVKDLIGKSFVAIVNGNEYLCENGFFETGIKDVYKIKTNMGYELKSTNNHKLVKIENNKENWTELKNINLNDYVSISNHLNFSYEKNEEEELLGWLIGELVGDGTFSGDKIAALDFWGETSLYMANYSRKVIAKYLNVRKDFLENVDENAIEREKIRVSCRALAKLAKKYGIYRTNKTLTDDIEKSSPSFQIGFIRGLFDADGSVMGNHKKGISIRLNQSNKNLLERVQRILLRFGIMSKVDYNRREEGYRLLPDNKGYNNYKEYFCKKNYELIISRENIKKYNDVINFIDPIKKEKLLKLLNSYKRKMYKQKYEDFLVSKEYIGKEKVYDCTINNIHEFCANGFRVHNCGEVSMFAYETFDDKNGGILRNKNGYPIIGRSGWAFCNLTEINGKRIKTEEDFEKAVIASSIIGTCQAGYTKFPYLGEVTEGIVRRESLLGCSITGIMDNPDIILNPDIQKRMAEKIKEVNKEIASKIGINPAARVTVVKPAGTTSLILGSASGIHPHHAKRYFRRIQGNKNETPLQFFKMWNPIAVEESQWSVNKTDEIITFCIEVPKGAKVKNQISALEMLEYVKTTQQNWIKYGTNEELCVLQGMKHNVSNTIHVKDNEWEDVADYIYKNREFFTGVSLVSIHGDKDYVQAPNCAVYTASEILHEYGDGSLLASGLIVDGLKVFNDDLWAACDCVLDIGEALFPKDVQRLISSSPEEKKRWEEIGITVDTKYALIEGWLKDNVKDIKLKRDWIRRANQFARRYFDGDIKKMTYCLKDVRNMKLWLDLNREYNEVDYTQLIEDRDDTKIQETIACGGGSCEIHI